MYDSVERVSFWVGCKRRGCRWDPCHDFWRRRTVAVIMSGLDSPEPVVFVTLTAPGADVLPDAGAIKRWNAGIGPRWTRVVRELRRAFPDKRVSYARIRELQKRGAEHVHALVRGVDYIAHALLVQIAERAGFGFVWIGRVESRKGAASYVGSYLAKSRQAFPKGTRVFTTSAGWRVGWQERRPEVGRYISAPPDWTSWYEWAGSHETRMAGRRLRALRRRTAPDMDRGTWEPPERRSGDGGVAP